HGGQSATEPRQGHDAALHLLWRLVDHLAGLWRRHDAGVDAATAAHRGGIDERGRRDARLRLITLASKRDRTDRSDPAADLLRILLVHVEEVSHRRLHDL